MIFRYANSQCFPVDVWEGNVDFSEIHKFSTDFTKIQGGWPSSACLSYRLEFTFFQKVTALDIWAPSVELAPPLTGNPGSSTDNDVATNCDLCSGHTDHPSKLAGLCVGYFSQKISFSTCNLDWIFSVIFDTRMIWDVYNPTWCLDSGLNNKSIRNNLSMLLNEKGSAMLIMLSMMRGESCCFSPVGCSNIIPKNWFHFLVQSKTQYDVD